jgi:hypothetical protein
MIIIHALTRAAAFFVVVSLSLSLFSETLAKHLIISAGALEDQGAFDAFYQSRIFVGEQNPPFYVSDAAKGVAYKDSFRAVYYSPMPRTKEEIIKALAQGSVRETKGLLGPSFWGFSKDKFEPSLAKIASFLGAVETSFSMESVGVKDAELLIIRQKGSKEAMPTSALQLERVPVVEITEPETKTTLVMVARAVGAWENKIGLVDKLKKASPRASYLDLGLSQERDPYDLKKGLMAEIQKRDPVVMFAGTAEMADFLKHERDEQLLPWCFPFGKAFELSLPKKAPSESLHFWSLAYDEGFWPLFEALGTPKKIDDATSLMRTTSILKPRALNVVRVFSENAAANAARSLYVDLVLLMASDNGMQLSSREKIVSGLAKEGYERVAPIVRISPSDVSEVILSGENAVTQVEILRHKISDQDPKASL